MKPITLPIVIGEIEIKPRKLIKKANFSLNNVKHDIFKLQQVI